MNKQQNAPETQQEQKNADLTIQRVISKSKLRLVAGAGGGGTETKNNNYVTGVLEAVDENSESA
jgi:hypothetical protein